MKAATSSNTSATIVPATRMIANFETFGLDQAHLCQSRPLIFPFLKAIVMAHQQVRLDLAHRIKHHADRDQHTCAAKNPATAWGIFNLSCKIIGKTGDSGKEQRTCQRDPAHRVVQVIARGLSRPHTGNVTAVLLEIVCNLVSLNCVATQKYEKNKIINPNRVKYITEPVFQICCHVSENFEGQSGCPISMKIFAETSESQRQRSPASPRRNSRAAA